MEWGDGGVVRVPIRFPVAGGRWSREEARLAVLRAALAQREAEVRVLRQENRALRARIERDPVREGETP